MDTCTAKIRPFPDDTELRCVEEPDHGPSHTAVLKDYAWPGSKTEISWDENDRRTFRGDWKPCEFESCILPADHRGRHAT